jgi:hypothetical protein
LVVGIETLVDGDCLQHLINDQLIAGLKPGEAAREGRWEPSSAATMHREPEVWAAVAKRIDDPEKLGALADRLLRAEGINGLDGGSRPAALGLSARTAVDCKTVASRTTTMED